MTDTQRDIAVLLATKQYTGSPHLDEDVWQESLTDDEREDHLDTAVAILQLIKRSDDEIRALLHHSWYKVTTTHQFAPYGSHWPDTQRCAVCGQHEKDHS